MIWAKLYFKWPLNLFNPIQVIDSWTKSTMAAEDLLLFISYHCSQRHVLECIIDPWKATVGVIDVFSQSLGALIAKAKIFIYMPVFVVASEEYYLFGVAKFERHQKANDFQTELSLIHVVSKEEVVKCVYVSILLRCLPNIKEAHQVDVLPVNVSKYFDRRLNFSNQNWLGSEDLTALVR